MTREQGVSGALSGEDGTWSDAFQARCHDLARRLVEAEGDGPTRATLWQELFCCIASDLERWCRATRALRVAGLVSEDDWRAVLLRVVERLVARDHANLRAYLEHHQTRKALGTLGRTPLEAWLRHLVRYAASDEVSRTLAVRRVRPQGGCHTMERLGADELPAGPSVVTDLAIKQRSAWVRRAVATLDDEQRGALLRRVEGESYAEIGHAMALSEDEAERLVRSAKARLRRSLREGQRR